MIGRQPLIFALLALAVLAGGCQQNPPGWIPVLEMTSTEFIEEETQGAMERIAEARASLATEPDEARDRLDEAEETLRRLTDLYLPVYRAKTKAYNAYRLLHLDRGAQAGEELQEIEALILEVSREATPPLLGELERIEELTARARIEVEGGSDGAPLALQRLAEGLERFVLKRDLWI